jgi:dephospho-CoA kinase
VLRVGLTGGLGCGKSTVLQMFSQLGAATLSADDVVHQLYEPAQPAYSQIVQHFGRAILAPSGQIDRHKLADIVFRDPAQLAVLEKIVHPLVLRRQEQWLDEQAGRNGKDAPKIAMIEIPLLFEKNLQASFHKTVTVICDDQVQSERFRKRNPELSSAEAEGEIRRRSAAQLSSRQKAERADYVIDNSGPQAATNERVKEVYHDLLKENFALSRQSASRK